MRHRAGIPELLAWIDSREDNEGDAAELAELDQLTAEQGIGEIWREDWLRIWTDGRVDNPADHRLTEGGCGINLGANHPWNIATTVSGSLLNSYRAELQAARLLLTGARR